MTTPKRELTVEADAHPDGDAYTVHLPDGRNFVIETDADAERLWRYMALAIVMRMGSRAPGAVVASVVPIVVDIASGMGGGLTRALREKLTRPKSTRDPRCVCLMPDAGHDIQCPARRPVEP